jgi:uncharacterized protein YlxP (DUF503 family)
MAIGILTIHIRIPRCQTLKEKRSRIRPLIARLHREFNISVAEMDKNDSWQESVLVCALVSNDQGHAQRALSTVQHWIENNWPDLQVVGQQVEII